MHLPKSFHKITADGHVRTVRDMGTTAMKAEVPGDMGSQTMTNTVGNSGSTATNRQKTAVKDESTGAGVTSATKMMLREGLAFPFEYTECDSLITTVQKCVV